MKKIFLFATAAAVLMLAACSKTESDPPAKRYVASFEGLLTTPETDFQMAEPSEPYENDETEFTDVGGEVSFYHNYWSWLGTDYTFNGFTYTNRTDNSSPGSYDTTCSITGAGKTGTTYLAVYDMHDMSGTYPYFTIDDPAKYALKGVWVTNSTLAYYDMLDGGAVATAFTTGSWYTITATGYDAAGEVAGTAACDLARYTSDSDKPVGEWIWFDMSAIADAVKVEFTVTSSDTGAYMNTAAYFCMDAVTLVEK